MALFNYMLRLGTELVGSNMDLTPLPTEGDSDGSGEGSGDGEETDETEDTDGAEGSDGEDTDGEGSDDEGSDDDTEGEDADGEGSDGDDSDGETDGDSDGDSDGDGDSKGGSDGEGSDGDSDSDGEAGDGDGDGDSKGDSDGEGTDDGSDAFGDPGAEGGGSDSKAGGHCDLGDDPRAYLDGLLAALEANTPDLLDNNEAMTGATDGEREDDCLDYEQVWRPFDPSLDEITRPYNESYAAKIYRDDARLLTAGIRSQFRAKFLMAKTKKVIHGTRRGKDLSERRLVESFIEIKSGIRPSRPYFQDVKEDDVSIAVAVVGDQSGSMSGDRARSAATAMTAVAEAFDTLGSPVMCCGPRNGSRPSAATKEDWRSNGQHTGLFHRVRGTRIDLFKDWDEPFRVAKDRFGSYTATGGTPLSDGIQFAMQELSQRGERYRVILVLTDGVPNRPNVVRRQIRIAAEAGIFIIGVGIGSDAGSVRGLFPVHVTVPSLDTLAKRMMETLSAIVFPKHAKKAALDGLMASGGFR